MVKIFVGNCSDSATNEDLRALFSRYGKVVEADIINGKGYGFVHMENQNHADAAIAALDGSDFKGRKVRVELSSGGSRQKSGGGGGGGPQRNGRSTRGSSGGGVRSSPRDYPPPRNAYGSSLSYSKAPGRGPSGYDDPYHRGPDPYSRGGSYYRDGGPLPPPSSYPRDRYERGMPPPPERYRGGYDSYDRRPPDDMYGRRSPPPAAGGYYGRGRSPPPPPPRGRSPPRSYGMSAAGRYGDDPYEMRRQAPMNRGRSPPPRGPPMRPMM